MKLPLKRFCKSKYVITAVAIFVVYYVIEVYIYKFVSYRFNKLECSDAKVCVKILLVADPQLIGLHNEIVHPLTGLAIFDIDRYLARTYKVAFNFVQPDVVIFLGDLFDEGSTASQFEHDVYRNRFHKIYGKPSKDLQHIYLPGDNDIGGEGFDIITQEKVARFNSAFNQSNIVEIKTVTFYKYNRLTNTEIQPLPPKESDEIVYVNVGLSHIPFLIHENMYVLNMIKATQPHVIFSAHEHKASIVEMDREAGFRNQIYINPETNEVYRYFLTDDKVFEFIVPTASYRMGTDKIGHGYAILEEDRVFFTVLWSPQRFPQLIIYGVLVLIGVLYGVFSCFRVFFVRRPRKRPSTV